MILVVLFWIEMKSRESIPHLFQSQPSSSRSGWGFLLFLLKTILYKDQQAATNTRTDNERDQHPNYYSTCANVECCSLNLSVAEWRYDTVGMRPNEHYTVCL